MGVPASKRVRRRCDFLRIRAEGKAVPCKSFVIQYCEPAQEPGAGHRLGVIASRRVGNAVKRNRGKRMVRELFRMHESKLGSSCDLVVILRANFSRYSFSELKLHYLNACAIISRNLSHDTAEANKG